MSAGGQSYFSHDANKLQFTSALQPCQHVKLLVDSLCQAGIDPHSHPDTNSTIGKDLPDANRKIPMLPAHSKACLVTYWDCDAQAVRIHQYHSMLFGFPLAVTAFNRLPIGSTGQGPLRIVRFRFHFVSAGHRNSEFECPWLGILAP